jgi:hypothetical protein
MIRERFLFTAAIPTNPITNRIYVEGSGVGADGTVLIAPTALISAPTLLPD